MNSATAATFQTCPHGRTYPADAISNVDCSACEYVELLEDLHREIVHLAASDRSGEFKGEIGDCLEAIEEFQKRQAAAASADGLRAERAFR